MRELDIKNTDKILIVAPHPDDECIGTGGLLLKYATQCDVIVLTDGRQGQGNHPPAEEKKIRKQEFLHEMKFLNVHDFKMLEIEDGTLLSHIDCLRDFPMHDYNIIFVTGIQDGHPDHKAAFMSVREAVQKMSDRILPRCICYEVHTPMQNPTHFLDISDCLNEKIELIRMHESQLKDLPYDSLAEHCASYRATLFRMPKKKIEVYEEVNFAEITDMKISETDVLLQKERVTGWTLKRWISRLLDGEKIAEILHLEGAGNVYIYGYGELGKLLVKELKKEGINVEAVIDRRAEQFKEEKIDVIRLENASVKTPVIISVVYEMTKVSEILRQAGFNKIFFLKNLIEGE